MERRLLTLLAETPIHAGGPESLAAVDLPIQREAATGLPVIWGQSLKGALRQAWRDAKLPDEEVVFGSRPPRSPDGGRNGEGADDNDEAGAGDQDGDAKAGRSDRSLTKGTISVGDAQLVLFPAATLREVFAWVTTPLLLSRLARKLRLLGTDSGAALQVTLTGGYGLGSPGWEKAQVIGPFVETIRADTAAGTIGAILSRLICPDDDGAFDFTRQKMAADVLVVEDTTITGLARMGTDVVARVQLDQSEENTKKVVHGPFYSEHLPAETVLAAVLAGSEDHLDRLAGLLDGKPMQLGGDETIGKGVLWCRVHTPSSSALALGVPQPDASATEAGPTPAPARSAPPSPEKPSPEKPSPEKPSPENRPSPAALFRRKRG